MKRLWYVDNLRIFLISLVVLQHLAISYGAPGSWYYNESEPDGLLILPMAMFVATNQAFFMGLFFLISAYFTEISLKSKTPGRFLASRMLRLGIPILLFYFLISPGMGFMLVRRLRDPGVSFLSIFLEGDWFGIGPLWFVEALLIFTLIYLGFRGFGSAKQQEKSETRPLPRSMWVILLAGNHRIGLLPGQDPPAHRMGHPRSEPATAVFPPVHCAVPAGNHCRPPQMVGAGNLAKRCPLVPLRPGFGLHRISGALLSWRGDKWKY